MTTAYVEVEVSIGQFQTDDLVQTLHARGLRLGCAELQALSDGPGADAAYRALTPDTPEPIRTFVLQCAGRIG